MRHILATAMSYGWLDREQKDASLAFVDSRNQAVALQSAREGTVLLKNTDSILPLSKAK